MLSESFENFVELLQVDNETDINTKFKSITKRLNTSYYSNTSEEDHGYIVGSLGRRTAIRGVSDLDMLFVMPKSKFKQYDEHKGNGQSALLQDVKAQIKIKYPHESIKVHGDGQVVVITFSNYEVEVCPAFENTDGSYKYPDTHDNGKWKRTDPMVEIGESEYMIDHTNEHFKYICQMVRAWKNNIGFKMGGLLVDTLVHKFLTNYPQYQTATFEDYLFLFKDLFCYLKGLKKDQKYWLALGSKQHVYNKGGAFVAKAEKAYNNIKDLTEESDELYDKLQEVFGSKFPVPETVQKAEFSSFAYRGSSERFIEEMFRVDIKYNLKIECEVKVDGFREGSLRKFLREGKTLLHKRELKFFIEENEVEDKGLRYEIYWKVRNRGPEAIKIKKLRGEIVKGTSQKVERTSFNGGHYVECYIVSNGICVAKDRINVPIFKTPFTMRIPT
ncbi:nucleotidyltransferase [Peribacillus sp. NPDC096447]|uniref:nucleotide-binding domain-containing protein n=1 Tax=Peribacillus sp. NPDC096447 TaxID=3364394 RepID=UPI003812F565